MNDLDLIRALEGLVCALDHILDDLDQLTIQDDPDAG